MRKYEKWMLAIDLSVDNRAFFQKVAKLADQFTPSEIHLVYVRQELNIPKAVLKDMSNLHLPELKDSEKKMMALAEDCFHADHKVAVHVLKGNILTELLKFTQKEGMDLVLLGRPQMSSVSIRTIKLVRKAPCSVLLVPYHLTAGEVNSILIPVDFSKYSDMALSLVNEFEQGPIVPKTHVLHVYRDATKYLDQVFETKDEIDEVLSNRSAIDEQLTKFAEHELEEYMSKNNRPSIQTHLASVARAQQLSEPIDHIINEVKPDLVVLGSKGKDTSAAALLGEVSESMVPSLGKHMTLILKQKGENKGLLKSLLDLRSVL